MIGADGEPPTFDPQVLTGAQRDGDACVGCHMRWPRPRARVGRLPGGYPVLACDECAAGMLRSATGTARAAEWGSGARGIGPVGLVAN